MLKNWITRTLNVGGGNEKWHKRGETWKKPSMHPLCGPAAVLRAFIHQIESLRSHKTCTQKLTAALFLIQVGNRPAPWKRHMARQTMAPPRWEEDRREVLSRRSTRGLAKKERVSGADPWHILETRTRQTPRAGGGSVGVTVSAKPCGPHGDGRPVGTVPPGVPPADGAELREPHRRPGGGRDGESSHLHANLQPRPHKSPARLSRGRRTRSSVQIRPSKPQFPRPQGPRGPGPAHSQYLMTAMLTGAVQVTTTGCCSEAISEDLRDPGRPPPASLTDAAAGSAIGRRCSRLRDWPARPHLFACRPISGGSGTHSISQPMSGIGRWAADAEPAPAGPQTRCGSAQARGLVGPEAGSAQAPPLRKRVAAAFPGTRRRRG